MTGFCDEARRADSSLELVISGTLSSEQGDSFFFCGVTLIVFTSQVDTDDTKFS